jgi:hypothetical protein
MYRWHMKTIGYLGQLDKAVRRRGDDPELGTQFVSIVRILKGEEKN